MMQYTDKCTRCGLCCVFNGHDCKHLKRLKDSTTQCSIYGNHLGASLGEGYICNNIMDVPILYDDCPYNNDKIALMIERAKPKRIIDIIHNA